jgi:hypothetical protein
MSYNLFHLILLQVTLLEFYDLKYRVYSSIKFSALLCNKISLIIKLYMLIIL